MRPVDAGLSVWGLLVVLGGGLSFLFASQGLGPGYLSWGNAATEAVLEAQDRAYRDDEAAIEEREGPRPTSRQRRAGAIVALCGLGIAVGGAALVCSRFVGLAALGALVTSLVGLDLGLRIPHVLARRAHRRAVASPPSTSTPSTTSSTTSSATPPIVS